MIVFMSRSLLRFLGSVMFLLRLKVDVVREERQNEQQQQQWSVV
jgi:hypothetical protein